MLENNQGHVADIEFLSTAGRGCGLDGGGAGCAKNALFSLLCILYEFLASYARNIFFLACLSLCLFCVYRSFSMSVRKLGLLPVYLTFDPRTFCVRCLSLVAVSYFLCQVI